MKTMLFVCVLLCSVVVNAATPVEKVSNECQAVLRENMYAMVNENADDLLDTLSPATGTPRQFAEFRREAEEVFATTDVYMSCVGFRLYDVKLPYADAWVIQQTVPKNESDHYPVEAGKLNFRHHSALLPEHKLVAYRQRFHKQNGQWKLHLVLSKPEPVDETAVEQLNSGEMTVGKRSTAQNQPQCRNGTCDAPFVRVR